MLPCELMSISSRSHTRTEDNVSIWCWLWCSSSFVASLSPNSSYHFHIHRGAHSQSLHPSRSFPPASPLYSHILYIACVIMIFNGHTLSFAFGKWPTSGLTWTTTFTVTSIVRLGLFSFLFYCILDSGSKNCISRAAVRESDNSIVGFVTERVE